VPPHKTTGSATTFIPGHPSALLGCRYHGLTEPRGSLAKSASVSPAPIAEALNRAQPITNSGVFKCPVDFGETILLLFEYPNGARLTVSIEMGGCEFATNGDRTVRTPTATLTTLEAVLGHDPPHFANRQPAP
jgi:hypothetical protein